MAYADPQDPRNHQAKLRWYEKNKQRQIDKQSRRKRALTMWVRSQKVSCQHCGFDNPLALVFHHRDPEQKSISIATAIMKGWSRSRIATEIAKCEVVCANCHAIEHLR